MAFTKVLAKGAIDQPNMFLCLAADVTTLPTVENVGDFQKDIASGSTCWVKDAKYGLIFDGTEWWEV